MKGIPEKDGWYWMRGCGLVTGDMIRANTDESMDIEVFPIPSPPDDGKEYACVWVQVQRDAEGKRTCRRCEFAFDTEWGERCILGGEDQTDDVDISHGPDCPLGSD